MKKALAFLLLASLGVTLLSTTFGLHPSAAQGVIYNHHIYLPLAGKQSTDIPPGTGRIHNLEVLTPNPALYEKFELQFDVLTSAPYPDLPYDPAPPAGLQPGLGVTVNAQFSNDAWQTFYTVPAFHYQPYIYSVRDGRDHFVPDGPPRWRVRFPVVHTGIWLFRITLQDAVGSEVFPASSSLTMTAFGQSTNPYTRRGFLHTSPKDPRYFEFDDGSPFNGVGFNDGFNDSIKVESNLGIYEQNKINFLRVWLSAAGINGSQWTSWASPFLPNDAYLPGVKFDLANTYNGADVSMLLDQSNPCYFSDFWQGGIPALPNQKYRITARVRLAGVTGPAVSGDWGFVLKQGPWLQQDCVKPGNGTLMAAPLTGSTGWVTVSGSYTTQSNQYWLDNVFLALQNTTSGTVYVDDVRLWRENDPSQVNLLREPNPNSHLYFDPMSSAEWDRYIQSAEKHGVYLKLVIDEKNEWLYNHTALDGSMVAQGDNNNFYAAPGTKIRWLQQAWWRYVTARWAYSPVVHSFEYINEGDPYNGNHFQAANSLAETVHQADPARHMVTTSTWAAFPNPEFWSNPAYASIDYADLHAYSITGWGLTASFLSQGRTETNPAYIHSGNASARLLATDEFHESIAPRGMVIRGQGEWLIRYWMKAENFSATCSFGSSGGKQRMRWRLDGGAFSGGKEGVVPFNDQGKDFLCTSPAGTYGWTQFNSAQDRNGQVLPVQYRLILVDNLPHELSLEIENYSGLGGTAWIDDVEIVSPTGAVQPLVGQFDITSLFDDTAWYNRAYAVVWGGGSLVGARKPLVRGEAGLNTQSQPNWNPDLLLDTQGIWLHNNLWGQVNPGGMADLFWWKDETIPPSVFKNYLSFRNFMEGIPLNNGNYKDMKAQVSNASLRLWGQRDDLNGKMHLWIQNTQHTWSRVVHGPAITPISGSVTVLDVPAGSYYLEWWDTYAAANPIFLTSIANAQNGSLVLTLPSPLSSDVAVKVTRLP